MPITCSLIITTYNWPEALTKSLESCLLQTIVPTEVIIADDGSKEQTRELIKSYQAKQLPFKLIHCWQEDLGFRAAKSRNNAILAASADYVICIDGDIILHQGFIEDHLSQAKKNQVIAGKRVRLSQRFSQLIITSDKQVSSTSALLFSEAGHKNALRSKFLSHCLSKTSRSAESVFSCNFSFWRQDAINVNGFNCDFIGWGAEDKEFCMRLINNGASKKSLKHLAVCYHLYHPEESRKMEDINQQIYNDTISQKLTKCKNGIIKYT